MIIKNGNVIIGDKIIKTDIKTENGFISHIGNAGDDNVVINAEGKYVSPGFVDIHTHGGFGGDFMDATEDSFNNALSFHSQNGTTSILTSSVTAPIDDICDMLTVTRKYMKKENPLCRVLGAHIEGPYISYKNKGAQHEKYLRVPSRDSYDFILDNKDVIVNVTIASELDGMEKMIKDMKKCGIFVSCGHDDGRIESLSKAIDAGVTNCTHWYCAMSTAQVLDGVRSVGMMELALIDDRVSIEIIADMFHITPHLAKMAYKNKGADKICVVSDCLRAGGMPVGSQLYSLGSIKDESAQKFIVSKGVGRLPDGTRFAGSLQPLSQMVKNLVTECDIPLVDAIKMATITPAKTINKQDKIGSIEVGKYADFCIMNKDLKVEKTIVGGKIVFEQD